MGQKWYQSIACVLLFAADIFFMLRDTTLNIPKDRFHLVKTDKLAV
jgi:hypothetical protein